MGLQKCDILVTKIYDKSDFEFLLFFEAPKIK